MKKTSVLIICTGNICRSPTAEAVLRARAETAGLAAQIEVDSAGTYGYHIGESPDPRSVEAASRRGYDLSMLRARQLVAKDFAYFDYLLAMDRGHLQIMQRMCPPEHHAKLQLLMQYAPGMGYSEVPDPYYGGAAGFELVLDLLEAAASGLIQHIKACPR